MSQQPGTPPESSTTDRSGSTIGRVGGFLARHPIGVIQSLFFSLIAIIVLQNLESTSFDVLFWSIPTFPKLVLIFVSMLVGAGAWELLRRWLQR
jgi:uncharacterized integral membrane protein